uniref:Uncharacterized protein n=1 Tax=viral metagenome TaxID=1070528 RepID=A0A6C0ARP1_9ZZZZ
MASFNPANANIDNNQQIVYNFEKTDITASNISGGDFFQVKLPDPTPGSVIYTNRGNTTYTTTNLYVYRLLHSNISGVTDNNSTIVGEVVVELISNTNSSNAYMCFLLESTPSGIAKSSNQIDDLLDPDNSGETVTINVESFLSSRQSCIQYNDTLNSNNIVFVFMEPIFIASSTVNTINTTGEYGFDSVTTLFNVNAPTNYFKIPSQNISMAGEGEIEIECHPQENFQTWTRPSTVKENMITMVSSKSDQSQNDQIAEMHKMTIFGCLFVTGIAMTYICIPPFYKFMVIDKIFRLCRTEEYKVDVKGVDKELTRLRSADIFIGGFFLILIIVFFSLAAVDISYVALGFFVLFFYLMSYALIQMKKNQKGFLKAYGVDEIKYPEPIGDAPAKDDFTNLDDIISFLRVIAIFVAKYCSPFIIGTVFVFFFMTTMMKITNQFSDDNNKNYEIYKNLTLTVCLAVIPIVISLLMLIDVAPER